MNICLSAILYNYIQHTYNLLSLTTGSKFDFYIVTLKFSDKYSALEYQIKNHDALKKIKYFM